MQNATDPRDNINILTGNKVKNCLFIIKFDKNENNLKQNQCHAVETVAQKWDM